MQKEPNKLSVVQISGTECITKCYRNMGDQIPQKRILRPGINGNPIVYIGDLTFEIRARAAVRHVIMEHTRELPLEQKLNFHQVGYPIKRYTDLFKYGFHMCRTRHFRSRGQCATEIQLLNTPHDRRCCRGRQAMMPLWCSSINTLWFPQKTVACTFAAGRGGNSDTCHQDYVVTWQRRRRLLSIQALICF